MSAAAREERRAGWEREGGRRRHTAGPVCAAESGAIGEKASAGDARSATARPSATFFIFAYMTAEFFFFRLTGSHRHSEIGFIFSSRFIVS